MRRVEIDPNPIRRQREDLVFALELIGCLASRAQRLLIGATVPLLFIEKHLNVNMIYPHGHRQSERSAYRRSPGAWTPAPRAPGVALRSAGASLIGGS
jgi:hypothetical protein